MRAVKDAHGEAMGEFAERPRVRSAIVRSARAWLRGVSADELTQVLSYAGINEGVEVFTRRFKEEFDGKR